MTSLPTQLEAGLHRHSIKTYVPGEKPAVPAVNYTLNPERRYCIVHHRIATHLRGSEPCCDPALGGITLPCSTVPE